MIIGKVCGKEKIFLEITDFPNAKETLSPEAYEHLKSSLEKDIENYHKRKKFIAMLMAKKNKAAAASA